MFNLFLIFHAVLAIALIITVLLQRSDGGALGGIGGGNFSGMLTGRSSANFLTKLTAIIAALFLANSLFLAILSGNMSKDSILEDVNVEEEIISNDENKVDKSIVPDTE